MRTERFFVEFIGSSLNAIVGHPKGAMIYRGEKKKIGLYMQAAGVQHVEAFERPVEIWFRPMVVRGKSGRMLKQYDCLNFGITYKIIEDWLVKLGVIRDDNPEYVHGSHMLRCLEAQDGRPGIWVEVREVEGPLLPTQENLFAGVSSNSPF